MARTWRSAISARWRTCSVRPGGQFVCERSGASEPDLNQRVPPLRGSSIAEWDANAGTVDTASLDGRECYAGLTWRTRHLTAFVMVFPTRRPLRRGRFFMPSHHRGRSNEDRAPYDVGEAAAHAIPGATIDLGFVADVLANVATATACRRSPTTAATEDLKRELG